LDVGIVGGKKEDGVKATIYYDVSTLQSGIEYPMSLEYIESISYLLFLDCPILNYSANRRTK
jgi:hypothetical protein